MYELYERAVRPHIDNLLRTGQIWGTYWDWEASVLFVVFVIVMLLVLYYNSPSYIQYAALIHKKKAKRERVRQKIAQHIYEALEGAHVRGVLERSDVDAAYARVRRKGFPVGEAPTPWWNKGNALRSSVRSKAKSIWTTVKSIQLRRKPLTKREQLMKKLKLNHN